MKKLAKLFKSFKNPKILEPIIGIIFTAVFIALYFYFQLTTGRVYIENSLIFTPVSNVSTINSGKLIQMNVYEGERIKKGDPLAVVGTDTLRADTDGLVIMANKQLGGTMTIQNPVVSIINLSDMSVVGTIDENKGLNKIHPGQVVSFTVDALPSKTFWGYIDEISPTAKQTQLSFSISSERPTQQFQVYAKFNAYKFPEIKNGMSAKMTIYTKLP
jgi:multidrug resistance efflux pump